MNPDNDAERDRRHRNVKIVIGLAALLSVAVGLLLYVFAEQIGYDQETARFVAIAFLVAGFGDYLVLRYWDRLTARSRNRE
ncbi:MAG: hypothetical protein AB7U38_13785 [Hyphomicrobiales bacterium]